MKDLLCMQSDNAILLLYLNANNRTLFPGLSFNPSHPHPMSALGISIIKNYGSTNLSKM